MKVISKFFSDDFIVHLKNIVMLSSFYVVTFGYVSERYVAIVLGIVIFIAMLYENISLYMNMTKLGARGLMSLIVLLIGAAAVVHIVLYKEYLGLSYRDIFYFAVVIIIFSGFLIPKYLLTKKQIGILYNMITKERESDSW